MKKFKILHVIPGYGGGISSYVKNLISSIEEESIIIDVIGFTDYPVEFIDTVISNGGKAYKLPNIYKNPLNFLKIFIGLIKANDYSILHCHISGYKGAVFKIISKFMGIQKIIVHAHRTSDEKKGLFYNIQIKLSQKLTNFLADYYFTCSNMAAQYIFGNETCRHKKIVSMPNSIDIEKYMLSYSDVDKQKIKEELGVENNTYIIGHIGRFNIQKNHTFMIKIIEALIQKEKDFIWLFIGEGDLEDEIKKLVKETIGDQHVKFLGRREDIPTLLQIIDVLALPSLFEGLPTVAIEAQAAGVPVVLADTITDEANMEMGLANYIPIIDNYDEWAESLINCVEYKEIMSKQLRRKKLEDKGFTLEILSKKYIQEIININNLIIKS